MLQGADSDLVQLDSAQVSTTAVDKIEHLISSFTTVPVFYFTGSDWPSGVALVQAETRLNAKVESHQTYITPAFEQMLGLMLRLSNTYGSTAYTATTIPMVTWYTPMVETDDLRMAKQESLTKNLVLQVGAGLRSIESAVRLLNPEWNEAEVQAEVAKLQVDRLGQTLQ